MTDDEPVGANLACGLAFAPPAQGFLLRPVARTLNRKRGTGRSRLVIDQSDRGSAGQGLEELLDDARVRQGRGSALKQLAGLGLATIKPQLVATEEEQKSIARIGSERVLQGGQVSSVLDDVVAVQVERAVRGRKG